MVTYLQVVMPVRHDDIKRHLSSVSWWQNCFDCFYLHTEPGLNNIVYELHESRHERG